MDEIQYLENLLKGLRERFNKGEKNLEPQIRATAAKLDKLKIESQAPKKEDEDKKKLRTIISAITQRTVRRCCGR